MTAEDFREWYGRQDYGDLGRAVADLCTPQSSLSDMLRGGRAIPWDVHWLARMVGLVRRLAELEDPGPGAAGVAVDERFVRKARRLLAEWEAPDSAKPMARPAGRGRRDWSRARTLRLCRLAPFVAAVASGCRSAALDDLKAEAAGMVREWSGEGCLG